MIAPRSPGVMQVGWVWRICRSASWARCWRSSSSHWARVAQRRDMPTREPVIRWVRQITSLGSGWGVLVSASAGTAEAIVAKIRTASFFMALLPRAEAPFVTEAGACVKRDGGSGLGAEMPLRDRPSAGLDEQLDRRLVERGGELEAGPAALGPDHPARW